EAQIRNAAALALARFQVDQILIAVLADALELVELRVVARRDHAAVAQDRRRRFDDRAREQLVEVGIRSGLRYELAQQRRIFIREKILQCGQMRKRFAQLREVARTCALQRDAAERALDISDVPQQIMQRSVQTLIDQRSDRRQAQLDRAPVA